jgi:AsmA protein
LRAPPRRRKPERTGGGWVPILLWLTTGLSVLAIAVVGALVFASPSALIRDQIVGQIRQGTGRDVTVGATSLSLFPRAAVKIEQVTLAQPPDMGGGPTARIGAIEVELALWPLLRQQVSIERLVVREPVIELRVDKSGRRSWDFAQADGRPARVRVAQAGAPVSDARRGPMAPPSGASGLADRLALGEMRIEGGTVRYFDERTGATEEATRLDAALAMPELAGPLEAKGSLEWKAEKVSFDARVGSARALLADQSTKLALWLGARPSEIKFDGTVTATGADGSLSVRSPSLKDLAQWLGTELPPAPGFGPVSLTARVLSVPGAVTLNDTTATFGGATAKGSVSIRSGESRPRIVADLEISELDLNKYALPVASTRRASAGPRPDAGSGGARSIEDLIQRSETSESPGRFSPQVKGFTVRDGWNETAFDLSGLGLADIEAKLALGRLIHHDITTGRAALTVKVNDRVLRADFDRIELYEGAGRGVFTLDAARPAAAVTSQFAFEGVSALPLLKAAAGLDWIAGKGRLTVAVTGQGQSERQIIETLSGKADFVFVDGAIVGVNIAQAIRGLQQGRFSGFERTTSQKTDFSELVAAFTIQNGVAQVRDMRLLSPLLRVTGTGTATLPKRQIDLTLKPKLVASLSGQGGTLDLSGIEVPVKLSGPWDNPKVSADLDAVLKNPDQVVDTIKEIGKQFKGKDVEDVLKGLFGNKPR